MRHSQARKAAIRASVNSIGPDPRCAPPGTRPETVRPRFIRIAAEVDDDGVAGDRASERWNGRRRGGRCQVDSALLGHR